MGLVVLVVGVIGLGAVVGAVVVFAVLRSRRNSGVGQHSFGGGTYSQNAGYPPQQPIYPNVRQPYPPTLNQGHTPLPGQGPQHPMPYAQQPPHQGQ